MRKMCIYIWTMNTYLNPWLVYMRKLCKMCVCVTRLVFFLSRWTLGYKQCQLFAQMYIFLVSYFFWFFSNVCIYKIQWAKNTSKVVIDCHLCVFCASHNYRAAICHILYFVLLINLRNTKFQMCVCVCFSVACVDFSHSNKKKHIFFLHIWSYFENNGGLHCEICMAR